MSDSSRVSSRLLLSRADDDRAPVDIRNGFGDRFLPVSAASGESIPLTCLFISTRELTADQRCRNSTVCFQFGSGYGTVSGYA